jgi:mRNA-degrading endonuclease RelE of RelBE toxin-antitoxin system
MKSRGTKWAKTIASQLARAGNYRVLFELEGACLVVYDVGDRKDIYG